MVFYVWAAFRYEIRGSQSMMMVGVGGASIYLRCSVHPPSAAHRMSILVPVPGPTHFSLDLTRTTISTVNPQPRARN